MIMAKWERKHTLFSFAIALVLGGLAFYSFSYPTFERVKSFQILNLNDDGTFNAEAIIEIKCDNWFSFSGKDIDFKMYYGDSLVSSGKIPEEVTFKKNTTLDLPMNCNFNPAVFGDDLETLLLKDTVVFKASIKGKFTSLRVNSSREMELKMPMSELASSIISSSLSDESIEIDSLSIESISFSRTRIKNVFILKNTLKVDYEVESIDFDVFSDDEYKNKVSTGFYEVNQLIKAGDTGVASGSIDVNNLSSMGSGFDKLRKREFIYYISGIANIKISDYFIKVPIKQKFRLNPINQQIEIIK